MFVGSSCAKYRVHGGRDICCILHLTLSKAACACKKDRFLPDAIKLCASVTGITTRTLFFEASHKVCFMIWQKNMVILAYSLSLISLQCVCRAVRFVYLLCSERKACLLLDTRWYDAIFFHCQWHLPSLMLHAIWAFLNPDGKVYPHYTVCI